jgi:cell division protein FtsW
MPTDGFHTPGSRGRPRVVRSAPHHARLGRTDRTPLGRWFWEIDRVLVMLVLVLVAIGLVAVAAASPASAQRYSDFSHKMASLHYFWRQVMWLILGLPVMFMTSLLPRDSARRIAMGVGIFCFVTLLFIPLFGVEANGAKRWINIVGFQFQPSEFLKPCYVVGLAWLLSLRNVDRSLPVMRISAAATAVIAGLLMLQPDFGQTVIFGGIWFVLMLLAGAPVRIIGWLIAVGVGAVLGAYAFYSVARTRINAFLFGEGDSYQVESAHKTITNGGFFGTGPGGGEAKFHLPEAHTDYIFSVIGEEFGLITCLAVALLYAAIVVRVFVRLLDEEDDFVLLASAGLAAQFGMQAVINIAVNVGLAPSKGMTLPFISYGGSSMIAVSAGFGLLLAFTRRNPAAKRSPYIVTRT